MQNNQSVQSLPFPAWQRRAGRATSSCIQEHWGIILHPQDVPSASHAAPVTLHSKPMTFHVLPHWCNSLPTCFALPGCRDPHLTMQLPNNGTPPHLPCLWQFKPGGAPLLGEVMVGGSPGLSEQHTREDGTVMICPKFFFCHPLTALHGARALIRRRFFTIFSLKSVQSAEDVI